MKLKALFWLIVYLFVFSTGYFIDLEVSWICYFLTAVIGFFLLLYSLALASIAGRTLKKFAHKVKGESFIPDKFINIGIYACMRHPMHLGIALLPLSIALIWGNLAAILSSGWVLAAAFWFVLAIEEPELIKQYKQEYIEYMQKVPPFTLSLKCLEDALVALKRGDKKEFSQADSQVEVKGFEAKYYDKLMNIITFGWYPKFISKVIKDLELKEGEKVADFGAGTGRNALLMHKYIGKDGAIVGFEIGKEMKEQFLQKTKNIKNITLNDSSILNEPKQEGVFDLIFISFVFHGFTQENREKILKNAHKLLKSGGRLAILDFNEFSVDNAPFYIRFGIRVLECPLAEDFINRDLKEMLQKSGFSDYKEKKYFKNYLRLAIAKKA